MLIRTNIDDVVPGMFLHAVEGGWLSSPFWRAQLLLTDGADIDKLRAAGIAAIVIDDSRGIGAAPGDAPPEAPSEAPACAPALAFAAAPPMESKAHRRPIRRRPVSERERAQEIVDRSKVQVMAMFGDVRLGHAVDSAALFPLVEEIAASVTRDETAIITVTRLKTKDEYTYLHSIAVCALMMNLARYRGLPEDEVRDIGMGGLLHDIGKMAMPSALLDKPGALDPAEMGVMRHHPAKGHALLRQSGAISPIALDICLHHHERVDGRGYPFGLAGDQLSLHARMGAICDVYDAVTSERPYKRPWPCGEALARMTGWHGHFDPDLLAAFIESIGIPPVGALVRLRSNRLAVVIGNNDADPTAPPARAFYDVPAHRAAPLDDVTTDPESDPIDRIERGGYWFGARWPQVRQAVSAGLVPDLAGVASTVRAPAAAALRPAAARGIDRAMGG